MDGRKKNQHSNFINLKDECFEIKHLKNALVSDEKIDTSDSLHNEKIGISEKIDIENYLLDLILKDKLIYGKTISNSWLRNPFENNKEYFGLDVNKIFLLENDYYKIRKSSFLQDRKKIEFLDYFEKSFLEILTNQRKYLNSFLKFKNNSTNDVIKGFSIFLIWLSNFLKPMYLSFFLELLIFFFFYCLDSKQSTESYDFFIIKKILDQHDCYEVIGKQCEKNYLQWLGFSKPLYMSSNQVIQFFIDYLVGNDILSV